MNKFMFLFFTTVVITACEEVVVIDKDNSFDKSNEIDEVQRLTEAEIIKKLEDEGVIPRLDELDRTNSIVGVDLDNNGIRDDVDRWIEKKYPLQIQEAKQMARALQKNLTTDINNRNEAMATALQMDKAFECLYEVKNNDGIPGFASVDKIFHDLKSVTFNTKERLIATSKLSQVLSGNILPDYEGNEACDVE